MPVMTAGIALLAMTGPVFAQDAAAAVPADSKYVFNSLLFLMGGFLVMFMAAGFAMLEVGMVRSKNVSMQCTKNIALYSIAGLMFWVVGYNLMYEGVDKGWIGTFSSKVIPSPDSDPGDYRGRELL